jgi:ABC-type lipoprotein export system ATPase subunit
LKEASIKEAPPIFLLGGLIVSFLLQYLNLFPFFTFEEQIMLLTQAAFVSHAASYEFCSSIVN